MKRYIVLDSGNRILHLCVKNPWTWNKNPFPKRGLLLAGAGGTIFFTNLKRLRESIRRTERYAKKYQPSWPKGHVIYTLTAI